MKHKVFHLLTAPDALASSLARLLTAPDLVRLMGLTARVRVHSDFSAQSMADAVQKLYDDLLSLASERTS
jgi:glycosyltransferase involved in cell wall biosynthesis